MRIIGNNPAADNAEITAVASGTLPSGKTVVVNANGTVSVVDGVVGGLLGKTVFESAGSASFASAFDTNANSVVILYKDEGNSSYPTVIAGSVSGTSISFGTPTVISSHITSMTYGCGAVVFDSSNNKVAIAYYGGPSALLMGVVATVSGTAISLGSITQLQGKRPDYISGAFDSTNNKVVIAYRDNADTKDGQVFVCTVSGTSISAGSIVTFDAGGTQGIQDTSTVYDSNAGKVVICYRDSGDDNCYGIVGTVSGTSISFGSRTSYAGYGYRVAAVFDSTNNKVISAYQGSPGAFLAVGTVSGTSISFGTSVALTSGNTQHIRLIFDDVENKPIVFYRVYPDAEVLGSVLTVSGTSISADTPFALPVNVGFSQGDVTYVWDTTANKTVMAFSDASNSSYGTGGVVVIPSTNLTAENFIGFSGGVVDVDNADQNVGGSTVFESAATFDTASTFDSVSNKVIVAYKDSGNSNYATAVVGTVSGDSISFGTPVAVAATRGEYISVAYDANAQRVVVTYADDNNSSYGTAVVGTVSGTSISFGSPVVFQSSAVTFCEAVYDQSSQKIVIAYQDGGNSSYGTSIVGTVSGTSISFGSSVVFESANTSFISPTYDANAGKVVIAYQDIGNSYYGTAIVGTVSGTGISFGSPAVFESAITQYISTAYDADAQKVVVTYRDEGNSGYGTAVVGTVSGTSISFGSPVVFDNVATDEISATYDSNSKKVVISYQDESNSSRGTIIVGTVSGTSISFGSPVVFLATFSGDISSTYDSNSKKVVVSYRDFANGPSYGTSLTFQAAYTNITRGSVASGSNAVIDIGCAISANQFSLTAGQQYFVQIDGALGLTAADPSVIAGTAISATEIIVKG